MIAPMQRNRSVSASPVVHDGSVVIGSRDGGKGPLYEQRVSGSEPGHLQVDVVLADDLTRAGVLVTIEECLHCAEELRHCCPVSDMARPHTLQLGRVLAGLHEDRRQHFVEALLRCDRATEYAEASISLACIIILASVRWHTCRSPR